MYDSRSLAKVHSLILIFIIVVAAIGGAVYVILSLDQSSSDTIRIGVCADIDFSGGKAVLQGAILAAEQINAEGGILGRNLTIVAEDDDTITGNDPIKARNAMNKLISVDKADFILTSGITSMVSIYQEIVAEHKTILFHFGDNREEVSQKVLDNYDRYKYYFMFVGNQSGNELGLNHNYAAMQEYTGLNKVALWGTGSESGSVFDDTTAILNDLGMEVVHTASIPYNTVDFTSYFALAESRGAEIIIPSLYVPSAGIPFVKEYATRQSPTIIWGLPYIANSDSWEITDGTCNYVTGGIAAVVAGYPLTSHVIPFREAYFERWGEPVTGAYTAFAYDIARFVLPDAIERAGTIETDAVIAALEETDLEETSLYRAVKFTSSHDLLVTEMGSTFFQWQNGELKIVYPKELMIADNVTYIFPDWPGPWD